MSSSAPRAAVLVPPLGFALAVVVLLAAGRGDLAAPPLDDLGGWLEARGPVTAAMAVLRLAALAAATWMLVLVTVGAVAELVGATSLAASARRAVPPALRRVLTGLAGAGAVGAAVVGADRVASVGAAAPVLVEVDEAPPPTVTMSVLPAEAPVGAPHAPPAPAATTWTVAPGDCFWSIAEEVLGDALGRLPSDAEIVPYWRRLIDANRAALVSGDPDLILPGQVFTLPPAP